MKMIIITNKIGKKLNLKKRINYLDTIFPTYYLYVKFNQNIYNFSFFKGKKLINKILQAYLKEF